MIRKPISAKRWWFYFTTTIAVIILFYSFLCYKQKSVNPYDKAIPDFYQFWHGVEVLSKPDSNGCIWLLDDLKATYGRHLMGMTAGVLLSLIVGILMGCVSAVRASLKFPIRCLSLIPPTAMIAIYFVIFGTDIQFYIAVIAFGIFPTLTQTIYQSIKNDVADDAIYKAYTLGASDMEIVWDVIIPQIMPKVLEAVRMTVGPALIVLIAAEWNLADVGIGYRLKIESRMTNMNIVYIYLIVLCITSYFMDWSLNFAKTKLCPWYKDEK